MTASVIELSHQKVWAQLDNKNGNDLDEFRPLLDRCPDKDNYVCLDFCTPVKAIEKSWISINGVKIKFDGISGEDISLVSMAKKLLEKMAHPEKELTLDANHVNSERAYNNLKFEGFEDFDVAERVNVVDNSHNPKFLKIYAKTGAEILNQKLTKAMFV
jgi:predicted glycosyltransferase involved in capsule biosynthesis